MSFDTFELEIRVERSDSPVFLHMEIYLAASIKETEKY